MHPEVVSDEPGRCPSCGIEAHRRSRTDRIRLPDAPHVTSETADPLPAVRRKAIPARLVRSQAGDHEHHEHAAHAHSHEDAGGIEWEDDMVDVSKLTTPANTRWKLVDRSDDAENHAINWQFRVGDRVKIRLVNEMDSDHPMHHPFHIHGAGRFLYILARDGVIEPNLVWSDTVLVRTGETVEHRPRGHKRRALDGALPHRRTPRERHDVQLRRDP